LDKEGADVFYSVIALSQDLAQLIGHIAQIMAVARIDMPSFDGWDNSNMAMFRGFRDNGPVERAHHEAALAESEAS
jgi:hypothetical protein